VLWLPLSLIISFVLGVIIAPPCISALKKLKCGQPILGYVECHKEKSGTPTMGGIIFVISSIAATLVCGGYKSRTALVCIAIFFAYAVVGFLDDFIKFKFKHNDGLKPCQKIVLQLSVSLISALYAYNNPAISSSILLPWGGEINLGYFYIPFAMFVFLALTNAVNLTDGLDGLAATSSAVYIAAFGVITAISALYVIKAGRAADASEMLPVGVFSLAVVGGLCAFLTKNVNKASVFMGDTGSLALGGAAACVALFTKEPLLAPVIGLVFCVSVISVIIQVVSFKTRKKRVFLMSPYHHHLQMKGCSEAQITARYAIVTVVAACIAVMLVLLQFEFYK
jgi:phospho-N-acetylmuramoyl-pentapeptide-transferase